MFQCRVLLKLESANKVINILKKNEKNIAEIAGVMPNPTLAKLYEGIKIARNHNADLLLAVGGGSVCDYSKAVSVSVNCTEDPWEKYFVRFDEPDCRDRSGRLCSDYRWNRIRR